MLARDTLGRECDICISFYYIKQSLYAIFVTTISARYYKEGKQR